MIRDWRRYYENTRADQNANQSDGCRRHWACRPDGGSVLRGGRERCSSSHPTPPDFPPRISSTCGSKRLATTLRATSKAKNCIAWSIRNLGINRRRLQPSGGCVFIAGRHPRLWLFSSFICRSLLKQTRRKCLIRRAFHLCCVATHGFSLVGQPLKQLQLPAVSRFRSPEEPRRQNCAASSQRPYPPALSSQPRRG